MPMTKGVPSALNWMPVLRERCCGAARCLEANAANTLGGVKYPRN